MDGAARRDVGHSNCVTATTWVRRSLFAAHAVVAALLVAAGAWLLWATVSYAPDEIDPWPVGPGLIEISLAAVSLAAALLVAYGIRDWARTGRRAPVAVGDLVVGVTIILSVVFVPEVLVIGEIVALAGAGLLLVTAGRAGRGSQAD